MADDLLQGLKDAVDEASNEETDPKTRVEELIKALESMQNLNPIEKATLLKSLTGDAGGPKPPIGVQIANPWVEFLILFGLVSLIVLLLGYIGYRIYQNALARERYKELKKQKKEQKKKK